MKKFIFIVAFYSIAAQAMDSSRPDQAHSNLIEFKGMDARYTSKAFIEFQKAKIKAYAQQLLRLIPTLQTDQSDIYTTAQATQIITHSVKLFGGSQNEKPVPGYLEILEALESNTHASSNLHVLTGRLYELERALALAQNNHKIIEFGPQVKIPQNERSAINNSKGSNAYLLMDIDIYAKDAQGNDIFEEVKSFQFCSQKGKKELNALITGMKILKQRYGIACRMHTKYAPFNSLATRALKKNVLLSHDLQEKMQAPNLKPVFPGSVNPYLIDVRRIKIKRPECIVCYNEVKPNQMQLVEDLEQAHIDYLKNGLLENPRAKSSRPFIAPLMKARAKFGCTPGFLSAILIPCVARMEEQKWPMFKSTMFELIGALDAPAHQKVAAFGAELFYNTANPNAPKDAPSYKEVPEGYLIQKGANTGLDLDVLLQNVDDPQNYSFIEATTGTSSVKPFDKFEKMGKAMNAEVFILHDLDNLHFERTAYVKYPINILIEPNHTIALEWPTVRRTNACLQYVSTNKNIYHPITIKLNNELFWEFNSIYNHIKFMYERMNGHSMVLHSHPEQTRKMIDYVYTDLAHNIHTIFEMISKVSRKASAQVYVYRLCDDIVKIMEAEKESGHIGSIAFAILFLNQLKCTIPNEELQARFLPTNHQFDFDLDEVLKKALHEALKRLNIPKAA